MKLVIQCAGSKPPGAGHLQTPDGQSVDFVANPAEARQENPSASCAYARPDDLAPYEPSNATRSGLTWRDRLWSYNQRYEETGDNPCRLYKAYEVYKNSTYSELVEGFEIGNVYILSAGWGLIPARFLTPYYDITFSKSGHRYTQRKQNDRYYNDFKLLPRETEEDIFFFGVKDYLPLFGHLTKDVRGQRTVYYRVDPGSQNPAVSRQIKLLGCSPVRYEATTRTNWHYECARWFRDAYGRRR